MDKFQPFLPAGRQVLGNRKSQDALYMSKRKRKNIKTIPLI